VLSQKAPPKDWIVLGKFHDPISVILTNRADDAVIAGQARFVRVSKK
jgi:hypothetical protein